MSLCLLQLYIVELNTLEHTVVPRISATSPFAYSTLGESFQVQVPRLIWPKDAFAYAPYAVDLVLARDCSTQVSVLGGEQRSYSSSAADSALARNSWGGERR